MRSGETAIGNLVAAWSEHREGGGLEYKGWRFLVTSDNGQYVLSAKPMRETKAEDGIPEQVAKLLGAPPEGRRGYYWFWRPN